MDCKKALITAELEKEASNLSDFPSKSGISDNLYGPSNEETNSNVTGYEESDVIIIEYESKDDFQTASDTSRNCRLFYTVQWSLLSFQQ